MENNTITVMVSEEDRDAVQRADIERSSRRDILVYLMQHPEIEISEERKLAYQKEYDDKFFEFEQMKSFIEKKYVQPTANNKAINWSLDYDSCKIIIQLG